MTTGLGPRNLLLTVAVGVLLAACSGATAPAATSAPVGAVAPPGAGPLASVAAPTDATGPASSDDVGAACAIVTRDAVSQAMGFPVATVAGAGLICTFQTADSSHYLAITLYHSQADMASMLQLEPGSDHITGLGDDAFYAGAILFVRRGTNAISILDPDLAGDAAGSAPRDAMITLARAALPKL